VTVCGIVSMPPLTLSRARPGGNFTSNESSA
jgi:hypothetical protein